MGALYLILRLCVCVCACVCVCVHQGHYPHPLSLILQPRSVTFTLTLPLYGCCIGCPFMRRTVLIWFQPAPFLLDIVVDALMYFLEVKLIWSTWCVCVCVHSCVCVPVFDTADIYMTLIQSYLQLIRPSMGKSPLEQREVTNSCGYTCAWTTNPLVPSHA